MKHFRTDSLKKLKHLLGLVLLLLPGVGWGQTPIASYDFEASPATPTLLVSTSGGTTLTGNGAFPSDPRYVSGSQGFGVSNGTASATSAALDVSNYTGVSVSVRLASFSVTSGNGADSGDLATLAISTDGTTFNNQVQIKGGGNSRWSFASGTGTASRAYATSAVTVTTAGGGTVTSTGYSTLTVTGITPTANMRVRVTLTNDDANEYWIIDDIVVSGTAASASAPTLTTSAATAIAQTTATLGGNISNFGSPSGSSPAYGFVYSLTSANATPQLGGTGTTTVVKGSAAFTGAYTSAVTGLSQNSNYSYQAYATNGTGTTYGGVQTFSTPAPTITTGTVTGAPVCVSSAPASLTVNYTSAGSFTGTYSAELSDASGNFGSPVALTVTASTATSLTVTIPQGTANGSGYKIRVNNTTPATTGSSSAAFTINNLAVSVAPATLTINLGQTNATALTATETPAATSRIWAYGTSASGPFSTTIGGQTGTSYTPQPANFGNVLGTYYVVAVSTPGTIQTYQVSGVNLGTTGITITPPVGVEVSTNGFVTSANTNASPLTLPASGGSVANTTISVRLAASASSTNVSSNITNVSSTGSASVAVSGSVAPPASACLSENFNSFTGSSGFTSGNTGWTATGLGNYTSAGSSGAAANAAKFDDSGDVLITPTLSGTASSLSFFVLGNGTDASSSLLVEGFNGTAYSTIATLSNLPTAGATITYNATSTPALTAGTYTRFRFTYTKSVGNLSFDDLVVSCGGAPAFTLSTGTITGSPFCINQGTGTSISVPFTVSGGSFGTANVFTAQLSDASGSFATPTNLGTLTAVTS